jgi:hypothetical protein
VLNRFGRATGRGGERSADQSRSEEPPSGSSDRTEGSERPARYAVARRPSDRRPAERERDLVEERERDLVEERERPVEEPLGVSAPETAEPARRTPARTSEGPIAGPSTQPSRRRVRYIAGRVTRRLNSRTNSTWDEITVMNAPVSAKRTPSRMSARFSRSCESRRPVR